MVSFMCPQHWIYYLFHNFFTGANQTYLYNICHSQDFLQRSIIYSPSRRTELKYSRFIHYDVIYFDFMLGIINSDIKSNSIIIYIIHQKYRFYPAFWRHTWCQSHYLDTEQARCHISHHFDTMHVWEKADQLYICNYLFNFDIWSFN